MGSQRTLHLASTPIFTLATSESFALLYGISHLISFLNEPLQVWGFHNNKAENDNASHLPFCRCCALCLDVVHWHNCGTILGTWEPGWDLFVVHFYLLCTLLWTLGAQLSLLFNGPTSGQCRMQPCKQCTMQWACKSFDSLMDMDVGT